MGRTNRKLVICFSSNTRNRSFTSWNFSFSSSVTVPTPSGLEGLQTINKNWKDKIHKIDMKTENKFENNQTDFHAHGRHKKRMNSGSGSGPPNGLRLPCSASRWAMKHGDGSHGPCSAHNTHRARTLDRAKTNPEGMRSTEFQMHFYRK